MSQNDSLVFKTGDTMVGEIKSMDRGVLRFETDYSDKDFSIEWEKIRLINTITSFFITLTDGVKYYGKIKSISDTTLSILSGNKIIRECTINDIVFLQQLKKSFWDRLHASIDIGFSTTKANNLRQLSSRSTIGYRADKWLIDATFNSLFSRQDSVEAIRRSDGKIDYRFVLPRRWYSIATVSLAKNTEQRLNLRLNAQLGFGRFFIRTNSAYWGVNLGVNRNVEQYSSETEDRNSWEGYIGTELNLYDIGDLSLLTSLKAYPGITKKERLRVDFTGDTKYDLPYGLYIKIGLTFNYDNIPAEEASETDYIFHTGFGWEW
jgi:hypothetical protein